MIPCTQLCIYQDSGNCSLKRAGSRGNAPTIEGDCAYLIQRADAAAEAAAENRKKTQKPNRPALTATM